MYHDNNAAVTGLEVTYQPQEEEKGYLAQTHLFGKVGSHEEQIDIDFEITQIEICIDSNTGPSASFEGLILYSSDPSRSKTIVRQCDDDQFTTIPFTGRLIGFSVITSQEASNIEPTSIRSIQPIFDNIDCTETTFDLSTIENASPFSVLVGAGDASFTLEASDLYSEFYGPMDGLTYCGARTYTISG